MKKILFGLLLVLLIHKIQAQKIENNEFGTWLTLTNKFKISEKLVINNSVQWRLVDFLTHTRVFIFEPSINYSLTKSITAGIGYNYSNYSLAGIRLPTLDYENRFTQNINFMSTFGKVKMNQRLMFEERFTTKNNGENGYANRFRYRMSLDFNLLKFNNNKYLMGKVADEVRIRFTNGISDPTFGQNNFIALVGYPIVENSKLYMGYGRNYYNLGDGFYWGDHILNLIFSYDFDFTKKKL